MDEEFVKFVKRRGAEERVAVQIAARFQDFVDYLLTESGKIPAQAQVEDIAAFAVRMEQTTRKPAKQHLRAVMLYYQFAGDPELAKAAAEMRGARIVPNPFSLGDFMGVRAEDAQKLAAVGIRNAGQMLDAGRTKAQRAALAQQTGVAEETILELVKLSDLARIPGIKGVRARLYLECGLDSPARLAQLDPQELVRRVTEYVQRSGFPGVPTLPEEARHTLESTAKLPDIVEY